MTSRNVPSTALPVGKSNVRTTTPSHTAGTRQGNSRGHYEDQRGHLADGRSTAERSTGINHRMQDPIDPRMPNLSPA
jgi:hypothetical protein